jgi:tetratricopeptide (TPR) repeat protein
LAEGRAAYTQSKWREAAIQASERLDKAPNDTEALRLLARSSARMGRVDDAQMLYQRIGGASAMQAEDLYLLAVGLEKLNATQAAWDTFEMAHRADPNHPETLVELGRLMAQNDRLEEALPLARRLAQVPGWEARGQLILGILLEQQNDPAAAAESIGRALQHDPELKGAASKPTGVRKLLARTLLETGRPAEAKDQLRTVLASGPDNEASWLLSRALLQEGSMADAGKALDQSQDFGADNPHASEPAPYVGSARCAECHAGIYKSQQSSLHSRTFPLLSELKGLPLPEHQVVDPFNADVQHTITREGDGLRMETRVGSQVFRALVDYAFGSGDRGLTLVGRDEAGRPRELRLSRYNDGSGWDRTTGHTHQPTEASDYLGKPLQPNGERRCLGCHVTNFRASRDRTGPEAADHGIGCEKCHGPGGNHLKAVAGGFSDLAIGQPQLATGAQVVGLCAQCHSPRGQEVNRKSPHSIRFQAATLTWSKCYTENHGAFSCVTCHNPHRDVETSATFYEAKCLTCHSSDPPPATRSVGTRPIDVSTISRRVPCPVSPTKDCIRCHMPTVSGIVPHSPFTDHHIRVHHDTKSAAAAE